ncbi:hypothetical protein SteCoe_423 [Stentor coeruleus]|uniref:Uncharacterized protein n=1 Tax=Stentor coeruleus TaxID=5963 RepID=A0A1R2D499_9CILI|nr:hypothetical protein SteCoe_423 [Stentor coeruleus]
MSNISEECTITNIAETYEAPSLKSIINELTQSKSQICNYSYEHSAKIYMIAIPKDGTIAFAGCEDASILVINLSLLYLEQILNGHTKDIVGLKLSSDDKFLVSASYDGIIKFWDVASRKEQEFIDISPLIIETLAVSPCGKIVYIGCNDKNILVWEKYNKKVSYLISHTDFINSLSLFDNLNLLVSASKDYTVKLWNLNTRECQATFLGHTSWVTCLAISHKKKLAISGSEDMSVRVWNIENFKEQCCFKGHVSEIYCLAINQDETVLASGAQDHIINVWCLNTYVLLYTNTDHTTYISGLGFHNNKYLASCSHNQLIVHDIISYRKILSLEGHSSFINSVISIPRSKKIMTVGSDNLLKIWDLDDTVVKATLCGHKSYISCLGVSKDHQLIVSGSWDKNLIVWSVKEKKQKFVLQGHEHYISALFICNDSKRALSSSWDKTIRAWDLINGIQIACLTEHKQSIFNLIQDNNSKYAFSFCSENIVRCWSIKKLSQKYFIKFDKIVPNLIITKDDKYLITPCFDGSITFTNIKTGRVEYKWTYNSTIFNIVISDDYEIMCFTFQDGTLNVMNVNKNQMLGYTKVDVKFLGVLLLSADKKYVITPGNNTELSVINIRTFTEYCSFDCEADIKTIINTQNPNIIVTGDEKGLIKVWNIHEKCLEFTFYGHTADVVILFLDTNCNYLISGSRDFTVKIWLFKEIFNIISLKKDQRLSEEIFNTNNTDAKHNKYVIKPSNELQELGCIHHIYPSLIYNGFCQRLIKKLPPDRNDCRLLFPNCVNLNHIYSYLGQYEELDKALKLGCPVRRDSSGHSPLFYALKKDSKKCTDVLLQFMIELSKNNKKYQTYIQYNYALRDDLLDVIKFPSNLVFNYLETLFIAYQKNDIPNSLKSFKPPVLIATNHTKIYLEKFQMKYSNLKTLENQEYFVEFRITPMKIDLSHGTPQFFKFILSLSQVKNKKIFSSRLIKTVIDFKIKEFRLLILIITSILWLNLLFMILSMLIYPESFIINSCYAFINFLLALHEIIDLFYEGFYIYIKSWRNYLDTISLTISFIWVFNNLYPNFDGSIILGIMVLLNFIKGLNGFRAFDNTRYYIRLLVSASHDIFPFLFICAYSTLAFGALYSISIESDKSTFYLLWGASYELNLGVFENHHEFSLNYFYFMLATTTNIIMMLNLLISILGDSFQKFKIEAQEIDYKEKLCLITELECFYLILGKKKMKGFLQLCDVASQKEDEEKKFEKFVEFEGKMDEFSKNMQDRICDLEKEIKKNKEAYKSLENEIVKMRDENCKRSEELALKIDMIMKSLRIV